MRKYDSPKAEFIAFENDVMMGSVPESQEVCNCEAEQYDNNTSLLEGCDMTSYGFIEIGNHY